MSLFRILVVSRRSRCHISLTGLRLGIMAPSGEALAELFPGGSWRFMGRYYIYIYVLYTWYICVYIYIYIYMHVHGTCGESILFHRSTSASSYPSYLLVPPPPPIPWKRQL